MPQLHNKNASTNKEKRNEAITHQLSCSLETCTAHAMPKTRKVSRRSAHSYLFQAFQSLRILINHTDRERN